MRIRSIKPEFWVHPVIARLPAETRLMALALISWADDHGYFEADARAIRGGVMPFRDGLKTIDRDLQRLCEVGFIEIRETVTHGRVGRLPKWTKHQKVDHPKHSNLLEHFERSDSREAFASASRASREEPREEGKGREGKGREGKAPAAKKPKISQVEMPAAVVPPAEKPPRARRPVDDVVEYFLEGRDLRLYELGLESSAAYPDDPIDWPRSAAAVSMWLKLSDFDEERLAIGFCKGVVDQYLADPYWAGAKKRVDGKDTDTPQPYPWRALLSEKVWRSCIEAEEKAMAEVGARKAAAS